MKRFPKILRKVAVTLTVFIIGAVLGPVLFASIAAFRPELDDSGQSIEASRLIEAYRVRLPRFLLFMSIYLPDYGEECGYDLEEVFPDTADQLIQSGRSGIYSDYRGYYALNDLLARSRDQDYLSRIANWVDGHVPPYKIAFLRRCIEATLLADICMKQVAQFGDRVERFDKNVGASRGKSDEADRIVCTFVDGVASRKGIKLSALPR